MKDLIQRIKKEEDLRLRLYQDTEGNWTIGWGQNLSDGITVEHAEALFNVSFMQAIEDLNRVFPWMQSHMDSVRHGVFIEMVFNMGIGRFKTFKNTIDAARRGDWNDCAAEILDSKAARKLPRRYNRLARIMRSGVNN